MGILGRRGGTDVSSLRLFAETAQLTTPHAHHRHTVAVGRVPLPSSLLSFSCSVSCDGSCSSSSSSQLSSTNCQFSIIPNPWIKGLARGNTDGSSGLLGRLSGSSGSQEAGRCWTASAHGSEQSDQREKKRIVKADCGLHRTRAKTCCKRTSLSAWFIATRRERGLQ